MLIAQLIPCYWQHFVELLCFGDLYCRGSSCASSDFYQVPPEGASVAVVGRSNAAGRPVAALLSARNATVTVSAKTKDLAATLKQSGGRVVVAAGRAHLIGADYVRDGQTIIDVGINWDEAAQKLVGDVNTEQVAPLVSAYTPAPGGVGG